MVDFKNINCIWMLHVEWQLIKKCNKDHLWQTLSVTVQIKTDHGFHLGYHHGYHLAFGEAIDVSDTLFVVDFVCGGKTKWMFHLHCIWVLNVEWQLIKKCNKDHLWQTVHIKIVNIPTIYKHRVQLTATVS